MIRSALLAVASCVVLGWACSPPPPPPDGAADASVAENPDVGDAGEDAGTPDADAGVELVEPPSSSELVDDALRAGTLSEATAALYQALSYWSPDALPVAYRSDVPPKGAGFASAAQIIRSRIAEYSGDELEAAKAMLVGPGHPSFGAFPPIFAGITSQESGGGRCVVEYRRDTNEEPSSRVYVDGAPIETRHFRIYAIYPKPPWWKPNETDSGHRARVVAELQKEVTLTGAVAGTWPYTEFLDQVFEYYLSLGLPDPTTSGLTAPADGKIPLYITPCKGVDGAGFPDGSIFVTADGAFDPAFGKVLIPHELLHTFQFGMLFHLPDLSTDNNWPMEAIAVAMEDVVAPSVDRWSGEAHPATGFPGDFQPMDRSFACPEEPFHSSFHGRCKYTNRPKRLFAGDYSKFVFVQYQIRKVGLQSGLVNFLKGWVAQGGDPQKLFATDPQLYDVPGFQLSLIARPSLGSDYDPTDWEKFVAPGSGLIAPVDSVDRFTFRVGAGFLTQSKPWQLAPEEAIMLTRPNRFDASSIPLQPGATHRWLIEVPQEAIAKGPTLKLNGRSGAGHQLAVQLAPLAGAPGKPGLQFLDPPMATSAESLNTTFTDSMNGSVFLAGTVTNLARSQPQSSAKAVAYQVGLTLRDACISDCTEHFKALWRQQDCCEGSQECLDVLDTYTTKGLCEYRYCLADQQPLPPSDPDWGAKICSAGGVSRDTPSGLIPMREWAPFTCTDFVR